VSTASAETPCSCIDRATVASVLNSAQGDGRWSWHVLDSHRDSYVSCGHQFAGGSLAGND
jgi:hypothetical protein